MTVPRLALDGLARIRADRAAAEAGQHTHEDAADGLEGVGAIDHGGNVTPANAPGNGNARKDFPS
ncbi:MAG TPA: hypothetical protein VFJ18_03190 [Pararhizobium sp.]|nr:hypothetical protein [Pararhizobium sp.]